MKFGPEKTPLSTGTQSVRLATALIQSHSNYLYESRVHILFIFFNNGVTKTLSGEPVVTFTQCPAVLKSPHLAQEHMVSASQSR